MSQTITTDSGNLSKLRPEPSTLVELLRVRAREKPHSPLFTFLIEAEAEEAHMSFSELDDQARRIAAQLQGMEAAGRLALLIYPPGLDYIAAFFGCLYAGVVAVPVYPPRRNRNFDRLQSIASDSHACFALTTAQVLSKAGPFLSSAPELTKLKWLATDELNPSLAGRWREPAIAPDTLAFLQYTSGSTASPKGVMLTHANLLNNQKVIQTACEHTEETTFVSWLPIYHDMGLIGNVIQPLYLGSRAVLMSPAAFLQRPIIWLEAITRYKAHTSGGPNFAYDLCVRKIKSEQRAALDLSRWQVAFNGAEPVREETQKRFVEAFEPCGFRRESFYPCYGLAEATLFVSGGRKHEQPATCIVRSSALEQNKVVTSLTTSDDTRTLVSSGRAQLEHRVIIVNPKTLNESPPDEVGEIWISGPSVAQGYWRKPKETEQTFRAVLSVSNPTYYLRTGDLGFKKDGELYITGRLKDLIIIRGRNHYPQDIEATAEKTHPALRPGCGAAFSINLDDHERVIVVHEIDARTSEREHEKIAKSIRRAVGEEHELEIHAIVLIRAGSLPKTSSGKIQRFACRARFLDNELDVIGSSTLFVGDIQPAGPEDSRQPKLSHNDVASFLREHAARLLKVPSTGVDTNQALIAMGFDSLSAIEFKHQIESAFGVIVPIAALFDGQSITELAGEVIRQSKALDSEATSADASAQEDSERYPLTPGQRALWFLHQLAPDSASYNLSRAVRIRSALDASALKRAFQILIARHACLRTNFVSCAEDVMQQVNAGLEDWFEREDASSFNEADLQKRLDEEAVNPFDLETGPLIRVRLFTRASDDNILLLTVHHIVADFWSFALLVRELSTLYKAEETGAREPIQPIVSRYSDYVGWQKRLLEGSEGEKLWTYWKDRLSGDAPVLDLPADRPRPITQSYRGASHQFDIGEELSSRVRALSRACGVTLYVSLLTAFQALLHRYTGQETITVGSPTTGRTRAEFSQLIGYFVNPLVLRANLSSDVTFQELLARARDTVLSAFDHQDYPFAKLVERLQPEREAGRSPLFQVMFVLQKAPMAEDRLGLFALGRAGAQIALDGLTLESVALTEQSSQFDLTLMMAEADAEIAGAFQYNTDLFDSSTIAQMRMHLCLMLEAMTDDPTRCVSGWPLLTMQEQQQLIEWNDTGSELDGPCLMPRLLELQVEQRPDSIALSFEDQQLTYEELNKRSNRLAHFLQSLGIGPDDCVAVCMERSLELVTCLVGILKAGGAYMPLDPAYPPQRIEFMLKDAGAQIVLADRQSAQKVSGFGGIRIQPDWRRGEIGSQPIVTPFAEIMPENLAYVIYTSGSTGLPKGAMNTHGAVCNRLLWMQEAYGLESSDRVLQKTPYSFDVSVWEFFWALLAGARLVIARPGGHQDPNYLVTLISEQDITVIHFVPSMLQVFLDEPGAESLDSLRLVVCSGEALSFELKQRFCELLTASLENLYGPTEAAIDVSRWSCRSPGLETRQIPIGRPIANTQLYVLDRQGQSLPAKIAGHLHIGGIGLARGYQNRPDLTAEKFIPDSCGNKPGARLYKTGDLARHLSDGSLDFIGRIDHQVKIRGFRIEPGEIEAVFRQHPSVREAVVVARENSAKSLSLIAYLIFEQGQSAIVRDLRSFARERLAEYMIPSAFVVLDELPLLANGKIDRAALPAPEQAQATTDERLNHAGSPLEEIVSNVWAKVLKLERVGIKDNFFELGGHSLLAAQVVSRLRRTLRLDLPLRHMFESQTVAELAERIETSTRLSLDHTQPILPVRRDVSLPLSFAQQRLWFINQLEPGDASYNMPAAVHLGGRLNIVALNQSLDEIVRRHEIMRTTFATADETPVQVPGPFRSSSLPVCDLRSLSHHERKAKVRQVATCEARRSFDLAVGPLLRVKLLQTGEAEHVLLLTLHHIIMDGWSLGVLVEELANLYDSFSKGHCSTLDDLPIQYADFVCWQRNHLTRESLEPLLAYWKDQLDRLPIMQLPLDRSRRSQTGFNGASTSRLISKELVEPIKALARQEDASLFMTLLAGFNLLLRHYTGQQDIVVGTDLANRNRPETEALLGFFVNQVVLRTDLTGDPTFRELLGRVRDMAFMAYAHQDLPFDLLVEQLQPEREPGRMPLFQILFVLQNAPMPTLEFSGLTLSEIEIEDGTTKYDLALVMRETPEGLVANWMYNADIFDSGTIARMSERFHALLRRIVEHPDARTNRLDIFTQAEREQQNMEKTERQESALNRLKNVKRKVITISGESLIKTELLQSGERLPLVIQPSAEDIDLPELAGSIRPLIESRLHEHGALLFRGFNLRSAAEFENAARAICPTLYGDYGDLPREGVGGNIYSSTPYPPDKAILFHNESSHMHCWPRKQFFFCLQAAQKGGETPLVDSRKVYEFLDPAIRRRMADKQLLYVRNFNNGLDIDWQTFFRTSDRTAVEEYCRRSGIKVEWRAEGLRTLQMRPAIVSHPETGESVFFNQIQAHHISCVEPGTRESLLSLFSQQDLPRNVYYGDGTPIEDSVVQEIRDLYESLAVSFPWQDGDLLALDNLLTAHGRNPFVGPRKILVAMGAMMRYEELA
ncbi:MAG: amino acid adenylation domain-containing protein [Blastocatellia bacterium]